MSKRFDVAVVGTTFVDIKGFPGGTYLPEGRNLGQVQFVHGGVGRNVVETIAQLGPKATFVSTVDQSGLGQEVTKRLQEREIDLTYFKAVEEQGMGMWMAILNDHGDLAGSISHMPSLEIMEEAIIEQTEAFLTESSAVVLEIDLNERIAETIIHQAVVKKIPLYGIPGNLDVLHQRLDLLQHFQCFICNEIEAQQLTSFALKDQASIKEAALSLISLGLKQVVITLGSRGSYYYDGQTGKGGFQSIIPVQVVDTTGAGDSFFAGTVAALLNGESLADAVHLGTLIAAWTISSAESTCLDLRERLEQAELRL